MRRFGADADGLATTYKILAAAAAARKLCSKWKCDSMLRLLRRGFLRGGLLTS